MGHSTPNRPGWNPRYFLLILLIQVCHGWPQKNYLNQFSDLFENFSGSNGRNFRFGTKGRYRFFKIHTIHSLIKDVVSCSGFKKSIFFYIF